MKRLKYLSLAALVAFAACDDGTDPIQTAVQGTISGVVTLEGSAASGVTVELSSGVTATTDAAGAYSFTGVEAGAYTVTISNFDSNATFSSTQKAATISSAAQVVTVNFDGTFVRTSAILGRVSAGGNGLQGVNVSIGSASTTTDADGQYSFSGLAAGTYTVAVSGFDATQYSFANASRDVTVGVGESQVVSFNGLLMSTATVSGSVFIDNNGDNVYNGAALEDKLAVAGIRIGLEVAVGDTIFTETDANGDFAFTDLDAGTYKVLIATNDSDIPGNLTFGGPASSQIVSVTAGSNGAVNFAFDIVAQRLEAAAFFGTDADVSLTPGPGINPASGVTIDLYDTEQNASIGGTAGRMGRATTGADGTVTFRFARADDTSPGTGPDGIVFLRYASNNNPDQSINGENIIEVRYANRDSAVIAPDTFDILNTRFNLRFRATDLRGMGLAGWNAALYRNDTATTATSIQSVDTDSLGYGIFNESTGPVSLPDTFFIRLSGAQPFSATLGHGFRQNPDADSAAAGSEAGRYLRLVHDGTQADTTFVGIERVTFTDEHIIGNVHHEQDDSTSVPTYSMGDNIENVDNIQVQLYRINSSGTRTSVGTVPASIDSGNFAFYNVPIGNYEIRARDLSGNQAILLDTVVAAPVTGGGRDTTVAPLRGSAGYSTFAFKYDNTSLTGLVRTADGTDVAGATVTISPTAMNIQPNIGDTTLTVVNGAYGISGLREGPYMITANIGDSSSVLELVSYTGSGNASASTAIRDLEGNMDDDIANFRAVRLDTEIRGLVVNDRDSDFNVIDPDEALDGAVIQLYKDNSGTAVVTADSLVATDTTSNGGQYSFTGLREGRYIVKSVAGTPSTATDVLRGLTKDTAVVTTAGTTAGLGANNTRRVGTFTPTTLPRWNYDTSEGDGGILPNNFTFLFKNTRATGTVLTTGGAPVAGMTVSLRRCDDSQGSQSPPNAEDPDGADNIAGNGDDVRCTTFLGTTVNTVTAADGTFSFDNLIEGVYRVAPQPGTVGGFTSSDPSARLYRLVGNGDVENASFTVN